MKKTVLLLLSFIITIFSLAQSIETLKGLELGAQAPSFIAKDQNGKEVSLTETLKKGPVLVMFYRGQWCPFCNKQLKELQDSIALLKEKGITVIAITPELPDNVSKTAKKTKATYSLLYDEGLKIMNAYGVNFSVDAATVEKLGKYGIDLDKANGSNGKNLPVPATYVIGKDGKIKYRFFNPDYTKRASVAEILKSL